MSLFHSVRVLIPNHNVILEGLESLREDRHHPTQAKYLTVSVRKLLVDLLWTEGLRAETAFRVVVEGVGIEVGHQGSESECVRVLSHGIHSKNPYATRTLSTPPISNSIELSLKLPTPPLVTLPPSSMPTPGTAQLFARVSFFSVHVSPEVVDSAKGIAGVVDEFVSSFSTPSSKLPAHNDVLPPFFHDPTWHTFHTAISRRFESSWISTYDGLPSRCLCLSRLSLFFWIWPWIRGSLSVPSHHLSQRFPKFSWCVWS
eukprot:TRINITY_DN10506_c0_g1_i1.p1 TRINITY_DN10506_c0_g1~~TRINITY_DN10506_c0_g1_i1.p1  ORF type:complete len:284 (-),score=29.50 TRINITY_DN10506_c0_g1_i1:99-872(-)